MTAPQTAKQNSEINLKVVDKINSLNLEPIIIKLMDKEEGKGWNLEQAVIVEKLYKRFLILIYKFPNESIVPSTIIDTFWHYHILDTKKYVEDCENTFGYYLHHFPYFGMRGEEDAENLENAFYKTKTLYELEFKESFKKSNEQFNIKSAKCDGSTDNPNACGSCTDGGTCTTGKCSSGPKHIIPQNIKFAKCDGSSDDPNSCGSCNNGGAGDTGKCSSGPKHIIRNNINSADCTTTDSPEACRSCYHGGICTDPKNTTQNKVDYSIRPSLTDEQRKLISNLK